VHLAPGFGVLVRRRFLARLGQHQHHVAEAELRRRRHRGARERAAEVAPLDALQRPRAQLDARLADGLGLALEDAGLEGGDDHRQDVMAERASG
jgi:hypothetical protein